MYQAAACQTLGRSTPAAAAAAAGIRLTTRMKCASRPSTWPQRCYSLQQACARLKTKQLSSKAAVTSSVPSTATVFEPHIDSAVVSAQFVVLLVTVGAAAYWWYVVVPSARRTLAREKRAGSLHGYLVQLQSNQDRRVERWFYSDWLRQLQHRQELRVRAAAKQTESADTPTTADAAASRQQQQEGHQPQSGQQIAGQLAMHSGQLPKAEGQQIQQQKQLPQDETDPADDQQPLFWSLDNPIFATAAMMGTVALLGALGRGLQ